MPSAVLYALALYAAAGVATALAFVSVGLSRVLPHPVPATLGARASCCPVRSRCGPTS